MRRLLSPLIFISYSRKDKDFVEEIARNIVTHGFRIFLDTSNIDPGDNFVTKISTELRRATAVLPIITKQYSKSRWAQAELYQALTMRKMVIPIVVGDGEFYSLDDPIQRLLRDIHYVVFSEEGSGGNTLKSLILMLAENTFKISSKGRFHIYSELYCLSVWHGGE